jgi:hypothetical protein
MIGFIRVSDIPKMLVSFVVGIVLIGGFFWVLASFPNLLKLPEWVFIGIMLLILWVSFSAGEYIWERIRDRS